MHGSPGAAELETAGASEDYHLPKLLSLTKYGGIMWRSNPSSQDFLVSSQEPLPINDESGVAFSSRIFEGVAHLWIDGVSGPCERLEGNKSLFTVKGRFKVPYLSFDDIYTGLEFVRPLVNIPGKWAFNSALGVGKQLRPMSMFGDLDNPYLLTPLICSGTCLVEPGRDVVTWTDSPRGGSPPPAPWMVENCAALGDRFLSPETGEPVPPDARRQIFNSREARQREFFDPACTYTFSFFQGYMDMQSLRLNLGFGLSFDMAVHMDGQPFQLRCKHIGTGEKVWDFELWHESLLEDARKHQRPVEQ